MKVAMLRMAVVATSSRTLLSPTSCELAGHGRVRHTHQPRATVRAAGSRRHRSRSTLRRSCRRPRVGISWRTAARPVPPPPRRGGNGQARRARRGADRSVRRRRRVVTGSSRYASRSDHRAAGQPLVVCRRCRSNRPGTSRAPTSSRVICRPRRPSGIPPPVPPPVLAQWTRQRAAMRTRLGPPVERPTCSDGSAATPPNRHMISPQLCHGLATAGALHARRRRAGPGAAPCGLG